MERADQRQRDALDPQKIQEDLYLNWWGLLRRPPVYTERPVARRELLISGVIVASGLCFVWTVLLYALHHVVGLAALRVSHVMLLSAVGLGAPIVISLLLPLPKDSDSMLGQWIVAAREQGNLQRWDLTAMICSIAGILLAAASFAMQSPRSSILASPQPEALRMLLVILGLVSLVAALGLRRSLKSSFTPRWRRGHLPPWVVTDDDTDALIELSPSFSYRFPSSETGDTSIGVRVPDEVLAELSRINMESEGMLYVKDDWKNVLAVVIGKDSPVNGLGTEEIRRLSRQIWAIAGKHRWSRYQFASELLRLVQRAVTYEYDAPSTQRLLGRAFEEYGRFPLETLCHGEGDCECTAILGAALLSYCGFPCALFYVTFKEDPFRQGLEHHVALGLQVDEEAWLPSDPEERERLGFITAGERRYLYGETATDADDPDGFGVIPRSWRDTMEVLRVVPVPVAQE